jgi:hypothetical protein
VIGHYVNYRKRVSPSLNQLLREEQFRLFGLTARKILDEFPHEELLERLPIEERLKGISVEDIEDYLRTLKREKSKRSS